MFYVFYVNEGSLHALEIAVALGPVHKLQNVIEEVTRVPVAEQVCSSFLGFSGFHQFLFCLRTGKTNTKRFCSVLNDTVSDDVICFFF